MPRQSDKHRNIEIAVSQEAIEEALAMWITTHHGIKVDRKSIEIITNDGILSARITKKAVHADVLSSSPTPDSESE